MLIRKTTIVFAAAVALGFLTPVPDARSMKECSERYHTPAKANARIQCGRLEWLRLRNVCSLGEADANVALR
jgi:hypothetical protein